MKLIALKRSPENSIPPFPEAAIIPDSAIILPGRPLFVPDFSPAWRAELMPGVRVSRLGKGMAERFARRYYDAVTLLLRLCPDDEYRGGLASAFDNCVMLGSWIELTDIDLTEPLRLSVGDFSRELTPEELAIDRAVATIGQYMTIRNGDIICPLSLPTSWDIKPGINIEGVINNRACLNVRLK